MVCDTCTAFKEKLERLARVTGHDREKSLLKKGFNKHLKMIHEERSEYRLVQTLAVENPREVHSVFIDGADQAKFALSRFTTIKKRETGLAMKQKVTGVLFHGGVLRQDFLCFLTSADNLPAGANQTIDNLRRAFFVLIEKREATGMTSFPQELFIQLDNTAKDNKNRFMLAFCDLLVHLSIFNRVTVNFLPVGHTHEDIDRKFSRVSVNLKNCATVTVSDLHQALRDSQVGKLSLLLFVF